MKPTPIDDSKWIECTRIKEPSHTFLAQPARGGEVIKAINSIPQVLKKGEWLCKNPDNGHIWACSQISFDLLYYVIGKKICSEQNKKSKKSRKQVGKSSVTQSYNRENELF